MKILMVILKGIGFSVAVYLLIAVGLILSQWPKGPRGGGGLDFTKLGQKTDYALADLETYQARDGAKLGVRVHEGDGPLVVLIHGSGGFGAAYDWLGAEIAQTGAKVLVPDLRGHGDLANPRGDLAYIGQFEDDLADLIALHRQPGQTLVLMGHSSGGGLVVRAAGGSLGAEMDGAVLLAPYLNHAAPTMRPNSGGWTRPLVGRTIGLVMLNMVGIRGLNGLTSIEFNVPDGFKGMTGAYSYRLNTSYAPRHDYLADIAALPDFMVIVGREDEAFKAVEFEPLMSGVTDKGRYVILDGVSHLDVFLQDTAVQEIALFLDGLK